MGKNKVKFSNIKEIFIYQKDDNVDLWWTEFDKHLACYSFFKDIKQLLLIHPSMEISDAKKMLTRTTISYDPTNFILE
jgi:hypothetical protein